MITHFRRVGDLRKEKRKPQQESKNESLKDKKCKGKYAHRVLGCDEFRDV
jgi:hypothetical protein